MDLAMGIQENKNQQSSDLPVQIERFIKCFREQKLKSIINYFREIIESKKSKSKSKKRTLTKKAKYKSVFFIYRFTRNLGKLN
jgi:hypothetical protein